MPRARTTTSTEGATNLDRSLKRRLGNYKS